MLPPEFWEHGDSAVRSYIDGKEEVSRREREGKRMESDSNVVRNFFEPVQSSNWSSSRMEERLSTARGIDSTYEDVRG